MPSSKLELLLELMSDSDFNVRENASFAAAKLGSIDLARLTEFLQSDQPTMRRAAAEVLGHLPRVPALAELSVALRDVDLSVQRAAAVALGNRGESGGAGALLAALRAVSPAEICNPFRLELITALGQLGNPEAVPIFSAALQTAIAVLDGPKQKSSETIGEMVLGSSPDDVLLVLDAEVGVLESEVGMWHGSLGDDDELQCAGALLWAARDGLVRSGAAATDTVLLLLDGTSPSLSLYAMHILSLVHDPRALPTLISFVQTAPNYLRIVGLRAICGLGSPDARDYLQTWVTGPDPVIGNFATQLLAGEIDLPDDRNADNDKTQASASSVKGDDHEPDDATATSDSANPAANTLPDTARKTGTGSSAGEPPRLNDGHNARLRKRTRRPVASSVSAPMAESITTRMTALGRNAVPVAIQESLVAQPEQSLQPLLAALEAESPVMRGNAAKLLGRIRDGRAVEPLIKRLFDPQFPVSHQAVIALVGIGDARCIEPLATLATSGNKIVRIDAWYGLASLPQIRAMEVLAELLPGKHWMYFGTTAKQLGQRPQTNALQPLAVILQEMNKLRHRPSATEREEEIWIEHDLSGASYWTQLAIFNSVLMALGRYDDQLAIALILGALADAEPALFPAARKHLVKHCRSAPQTMFPALDSADSDIQRLAIQVLGDLHAPEALDVLLLVSREPDLVRASTAVIALGQFGGRKVVGPLCRLLAGNDWELSEVAVGALSKNKAAIVDLIRLLSDTEPGTRQRAATCLGNLRASKSSESLSALLQDRNAGVRRECVKALGRVGIPSTVSSIAPLLQDQNQDVCLSAIQALGEIGTDDAVRLLGGVLDSPSANARLVAVAALAHTGNALAAEILVHVITNADIGDQARQALTKIGPTAIQALVRGLGHQDKTVRHYAAVVIATIGDPGSLAKSLGSQPLENYQLLAYVVWQMKAADKFKELETADPVFRVLMEARRDTKAANNYYEDGLAAYESIKDFDPNFDE